LNIEQIATVCHETNRAYCTSIGDNSQKPWLEAEQWQRDSAIEGVRYALANPTAPASAQHDAWLADKERDGWKFGPVKEADKKEHPCFVPYEQLPVEQKTKDYLFKAVVTAFVQAVSQV
jgi:RyR domain